MHTPDHFPSGSFKSKMFVSVMHFLVSGKHIPFVYWCCLLLALKDWMNGTPPRHMKKPERLAVADLTQAGGSGHLECWRWPRWDLRYIVIVPRNWPRGFCKNHPVRCRRMLPSWPTRARYRQDCLCCSYFFPLESLRGAAWCDGIARLALSACWPWACCYCWISVGRANHSFALINSIHPPLENP